MKPFKNRVACSKPIQDVNSVIHVNKFEVLTTERDGLDNDVTSNASVVVEVSGECEYPTSKSVSVCTVLDNVHKGKNISFLYNHHYPIRKLHEENQKCDKVDAIP